MQATSPAYSRCHLLLAGASALALTACGGGSGDDGGALQILSFGADREWVHVGERVRLNASFKVSGGFEPGLGAVTNGASIESGVPDQAFNFRLDVELTGRPAISRTLQVGVRFRNRYGHAITDFVTSYYAAVSAPDGRVRMIVGGHANAGASLFAVIFDPRVESFAPLAATQAMRARHAAHGDDQGRVVILGGRTLDAHGNTVAVASVSRFEPASGNFVPLPPLREPHSDAATALLPSGQVLLFGGLLASGQHSATAERCDPSAGGQAIAWPASPSASHGVVRLPVGHVLLAGGEDSDGNPVPSALIHE